MKKYLSLIFSAIIFLGFGFYLYKNLGTILDTFSTTFAHMTKYFFAAMTLVALAFYFLAKSYQVVFKMNKINRNIWDLFRLNLAGMAVNVIVPTAGLSQAVIYAEDADKRGDSRAATINSVIVTYISDYSSIAIFLVFSLIYLYFINSVLPQVVIPAVIFIIITAVVYVLAYFAGKESRVLESFIFFLAKKAEQLIKFFTKKNVSLANSVDALYKNFKDVNKAIIEDPKDWIIAISYACLQHFCAITALYIIFVSLGVHPVIRVLIAAYSVGEAIRVVSPTPSGIGFVEGSMFLVFTGLGIPAPVATTATIIYRGLIFWIPLAIGFIFYQRQKIKDIFVDNKPLA